MWKVGVGTSCGRLGWVPHVEGWGGYLMLKVGVGTSCGRLGWVPHVEGWGGYLMWKGRVEV